MTPSINRQPGLRNWRDLTGVVLGVVGVVGALVAVVVGEFRVGLVLFLTGGITLAILWWFNRTGQVATPKRPAEVVNSHFIQLQQAFLFVLVFAVVVFLTFKAIDNFERGSWLVGVWAMVGVAGGLYLGIGGLASLVALRRLRSGRGGRLARWLTSGSKDSDEARGM